LTEQDVARQITGWVAALGTSVASGDGAHRNGQGASPTIGLESEISERLD
jgi:1-deoxy-D-xylulose-5-phosphate synthase